LTANFASPATHTVAVPEVAGTHVSITGFNYVFVPKESRNPIVFYTVQTSIMLRLEVESLGRKEVGKYVVHRRFADFRNLDAMLKEELDSSSWGSVFSFTSRFLNSTPEARIPLLENVSNFMYFYFKLTYTKYLRTAVLKVTRKDLPDLLEILINFLTEPPADYVLQQVSTTAANKEPNSISVEKDMQ